MNLFGRQLIAGMHDSICSLANIAVANFTRFRPSVIPARKQRVRRCCFTVRGLILRCPAISLLLQPCAGNRKTSSSRGVILMASRLIIVPAPVCCRTPFQKPALRQTFALGAFGLSPMDAAIWPFRSKTKGILPMIHSGRTCPLHGPHWNRAINIVLSIRKKSPALPAVQDFRPASNSHQNHCFLFEPAIALQ